MKNLYFDTCHTDLIGGGGLALHNLAVALQEFFDVHLAEPWNDGMGRYEFLRTPRRPFKVGRPARVDVLVASKYAEFVPPTGKVNVCYCLYPRHRWDMAGYDRILVPSEYSGLAVLEKWGLGRTPEILIGGAFHPDYGPPSSGDKENIFLNSARFFMEENGHSKNQHLIIEAFKKLPADLPWTLILTGSLILESDKRYLKRCEELAGGDPRIRFVTMPARETLRDLYTKAKVYVHAMGHGRTDPAETEHYGIAVEKALISGCWTVVHASGGSPEMAHAAWRTPEELAEKMTVEADSAFGFGDIALMNRWRTWEAFVERVGKAFTF